VRKPLSRKVSQLMAASSRRALKERSLLVSTSSHRAESPNFCPDGETFFDTLGLIAITPATTPTTLATRG
jgi:hypothetical protein